MKKKSEFVIVVGGKNSGKTSYLQYILERAVNCSCSVGGFISIAEYHNQKKVNYSVLDLSSGRTYPYATASSPNNGIFPRSGYDFQHDVFQLLEENLDEHFSRDIILFDEFGPLESEGRGLYRILKKTIHSYRGIVMVSVRETLLDSLKNLLIPEIR